MNGNLSRRSDDDINYNQRQSRCVSKSIDLRETHLGTLEVSQLCCFIHLLTSASHHTARRLDCRLHADGWRQSLCVLHLTRTGNIISSLKIKTRRSLRTQISVPHVFSVTYLLLKEICYEIRDNFWPPRLPDSEETGK